MTPTTRKRGKAKGGKAGAKARGSRADAGAARAANRAYRIAGAGKRRYKSDVMAAIHESAAALHQVGAISATTMRTFDERCLTPVPKAFTPTEIKRIREDQQVSQPVFARYLNTTESTVAQWESGAKRPGGMGMKLLSLVQKRGLAALE